MKRRNFLLGAGACLACGTARAERPLPVFCSIDRAFDSTNFRHFGTSGDTGLDRALIAEVRKINAVFSIRPGYRYIDDADSPNAFAMQRTIIANTHGTVLLGLNLIRGEMSTSYGGAAVAGIAAHEGAHIHQYFSGLADRLNGATARNTELHADYLAGYYFAQDGRTSRSLDVFARSLFSKGDYAYNEPDHHGSPEERQAAMKAGYAAGGQSADLAQVSDKGVAYVLAN